MVQPNIAASSLGRIVGGTLQYGPAIAAGALGQGDPGGYLVPFENLDMAVCTRCSHRFRFDSAPGPEACFRAIDERLLFLERASAHLGLNGFFESEDGRRMIAEKAVAELMGEKP